jgi:hypothetical protein
MVKNVHLKSYPKITSHLKKGEKNAKVNNCLGLFLHKVNF